MQGGGGVGSFGFRSVYTSRQSPGNNSIPSHHDGTESVFRYESALKYVAFLQPCFDKIPFLNYTHGVF